MQCSICARCESSHKTVKVYGKLDAAFNNAGIQLPNMDTADVSEEEFDRVFNVNMKGVWLCM